MQVLPFQYGELLGHSVLFWYVTSDLYCYKGVLEDVKLAPAADKSVFLKSVVFSNF